jgi:putative membrane protein
MSLKWMVLAAGGLAALALAQAAFAQSAAMRLATGGSTAGSTPPATGSARAGATASMPDRKFVEAAATAGMAEVAMAKVAQQRGGADVKRFANRMVTDHDKANRELMAIAGTKSIDVPDKLPGKDRRALDKLRKLRGAAFDAEYVKSQLAAHKDAWSLFKRESANGRDSDLKAFAGRTLPTLQEHLANITALAKKAR